MNTPQFPAEVHREISASMLSYATSTGDAMTAELAALAKRVCLYAHASGMTAEGMVIALRQVFDAVVPSGLRYSSASRSAYDRLLAECLKAYFAEAVR